MEKYHKQDVAPIEKENERDERYEASNPQIDSERTRNNYRFTPHFEKTYTEFINGRIKEGNGDLVPLSFGACDQFSASLSSVSV